MGRRAAAALLSSLLAVLAVLAVPTGPAWAHSGDLAQPIFERMSPTAPGVTVQIAYSANFELLVTNTGPQDITFLADSGEPFLRVGPKGVAANLASPTFYDSNVPEGLSSYPPQAKPGADVPPVWRTLSVQPNWGWYDHRLHPAGQIVPLEVLKAAKVAVLGRWTIPFRLGDGPGQAGALEGRFEYDPPQGSYTAVQKSSVAPADGLTIQVVSGRVVPAVFVKNLSPDPVVILGRDGEPFARIGPKGGVTEVNAKSPTWAEVQQADGKDPSDPADSTAPPVWRQVADSPQWSWLEFRAAAPKTAPPAAIVKRGKTVTVKTWSIPYLIGDRRQTLDGITQWVSIGELRRRAADPLGAAGGGGGGHSKAGLYAALAGAAAVLGAGGWLVTSILRNRNRSAAKGEPWTS
jgi:hypothetical protein